MSVRVVQTTSGPREVFVDDVTARAPTWVLAQTLWHYVYSSGITACGMDGTWMRGAQPFRPHTARKMHERTVTLICERCARATRA